MARSLALLVRILLMLTLALLPVACQQSPATPPVPTKPSADTLRFDVFNAFESLHPIEAKATGASWAFPLIFNILAIRNADGDLEPDLAQSWQYDPQRQTLRIELRPDARFHDGMPVTAADVIFSFERGYLKSFPAISDSIDRMEPFSEHALEIIMKKDDPTLFERVYDTMILPRRRSAVSMRDHPIGSGPYRFEKRLDEHNILLSAFADYHGGQPGIAKMRFTHVPDMERTWTRLLAGETDVAVRLTPDNLRRMKFIEKRYHINQSLSWFYKALLFNTADPCLSDVRVRRALSLGIDRQRMVADILLGYGRVATGPLGVDSPYARPGRRPRPFDPVRARALLDAAGWELDNVTGMRRKAGRTLEFDLLHMQESPTDAKVVRFIQLGLAELGVRVRPVPAAFEEFKIAFIHNTAFQTVLTEIHGPYTSPTYLANTWMTPQKGYSSAGGFASPEIDQLLRALDDDATAAEQKSICQTVEDRLLDLQPAAFLYQPTEINVVSKRIDLPRAFTGDTGSIRRLCQARIRKPR